MTASASASSRAEALAGMACVDTSGNERIPILMEMVGAMSRAREPQEVLREFSAGLLKLQGPRGYVSLSTRGLAPGEYRITRMLTGDDVVGIGDSDPWRDGTVLPVHRGGFFGELIRQAYPEIVHNVFLRGDPVVGDALRAYGSLMAVPLFDDGEPLNWAIMLREEAEGFTVADLEDAILRGNLVGSSVRNVLAAKRLRAANEQIQREVQQIARIQRALLPDRLPDIPGLSLGASYETYGAAGGDIYDFTPLRRLGDTVDPHGPWGIHIADAAGHGPAAATVAAMLNAILQASPADIEGPGPMLRFANHHLYRKRLDGTFVTAILARYEPETRRLTYARAGHNPAIVMRRESGRFRMERLDGVGGVPLGVLDEVSYEEQTIQLKPGQTVVLYTDGITEATGPDGAMFEVDGIERALTECSGAPDCAIGHITAAVRAHENGTHPKDDQTLLVMRVE